MTPLTKEQALRECIALWTHLAENPELISKEQAIDAMGPDYAYLRTYASQCPCCQYARYTRAASSTPDSYCTHCPVDSWRETFHLARRCGPCAEDDTSYRGWLHADDAPARAEKAQALVDLAQQSLAGLTI